MEEALGAYLSASLPNVEPTLELATDPAYRDICDDAVLRVWESATPDYVPSPQREVFLRRHCGNRPLTIPLLNAAWQICRQYEQRRGRQEMVDRLRRRDEPVTERQIDSLDDASVDRLYHDSLRAYADTLRR